MAEEGLTPPRPLTIRGALSNLKPEDASRLAVYLVRGDEIVARAPVDKSGKFQVEVDRGAAVGRKNFPLEAVVGPAAMGKSLDTSQKLPRVALDQAQLERAKNEFVVSTEKLKVSDELLKLWWAWCRNYCVSGVVLGPDGCPVPGAQVTVSSVVHASGGGYTVTPQNTVATDVSGHFTVCFDWCSWCWGWPCRPYWWYCWPWWWEWDILHILDRLEAQVPQIGPVGPGPVEGLRSAAMSQRPRLPLRQPATADLMVGQGFAESRGPAVRLVSDQARTDQIRRRLSDPRIRAIFPWWWWCCENPNIIFTVKQGPTVILNEDPSTDTRWCFPSGSTVTLIGNQDTISSCDGDPLPAQGFVWTRVGNTLVNTIVDGYAQGSGAGHDSDMAFTGNLDIFGGFAAASSVAYYQVKAAQWTGNPARGGTAPATDGVPIATDLYNYAFMLHPDFSVSVEAVKMGPFTDPAHPGIPDLYATEDQRHLVPATLLPAFPAGTFMTWSHQGLKVTSPASTLIGGGGLGAVRLAMAGFDSAFNPVVLPPNTDDHLTLEIDTMSLNAAHINSFNAFDSGGNPISSTGSSADCPAFNVGVNGYVVLNVSVRDDNGHLCYYELVPNFGHGSIGTTTPDVRGYKTPTPFVPAPLPGPYTQPAIAHVLLDPSTGKAFVGGTENITFHPAVNCCYDFRLNVSKRLTTGYGFVGAYTADFWTATLKVT